MSSDRPAERTSGRAALPEAPEEHHILTVLAAALGAAYLPRRWIRSARCATSDTPGADNFRIGDT